MPKIDIHVRRKRPRPHRKSQAELQRGPIDLDRGPEYLKRRGGRLINFYDLGQKIAGDEDIFVQTFPGTTGGSGETPPNYARGFDLSDAQATEAFFISETGDWKTKFKRIVKGVNDAGIQLYVASAGFAGYLDTLSSPVWTTSGLHLTQADVTAGLAIVGNTGVTYSVPLANTPGYKITTALDFSAPEVTVDLTNSKIDVFLVPAMGSPGFQVAYLDTDFLHHDDFGGFLFSTLPRPATFNPSSPLFGLNNTDPSDTPYPEMYRMKQFFNICVVGAGFHYEPDAGNIYTPTSLAAVPSGPAFVAPPGSPPIQPPASDPPYYDFFAASWTVHPPVAGSLQGVIQRGGTKYYVWKT